MLESGSILIIITGCMWATTGIFSHLFQTYELSSMMMAILRVSASVVIMTPFMLAKKGRIRSLSRRGLMIALVQGLLTQTLFNTVYFRALAELGMAGAVVMLYTSPITVSILSYFLFREPITRRKVCAVVITLVGCALTSTGGNLDFAVISVVGIGLGLIAGFCFGTLSITSRLAENEDPFAMTYYTMLFGMIGLLIIGGVTGAGEIHPDLRLGVIVIAAGAISVAIPYYIFGIGIARIREASMAPILSSSEIPAAAVYGYVLFGEQVGIWKIVGMALVMVSIIMINMPVRGQE